MGDFSSEIFSRTGPERTRPSIQITSANLQGDTLQPLTSPNPSIRSTHSDASSIPPWVRETSGSVHSRASRSSSIVSTRTRTSINTFQEDTRSIDIQLGGRIFRINRDGSRVSERLDDLPPYSPPTAGGSNAFHGAPGFHDMFNNQMTTVPSPFTRSYVDTGVNPMEFDDEDSSRLGESTSTLGSISASGFQSSTDPEALTPTSSPPGIRYSERSSHLGDDQEASGVSRVPSYTSGKENISVERRRTLSQSNVTPKNTRAVSDTAAQLKRRNGIRLPKLVTGLPVFRSSNSSNSLTPGSGSGGGLSPSSHMSRSAGPTFAGNDNVKPPSSPKFIGRGATGIFPSKTKAHNTAPPTASTSVPSLLVPQSPAHMEENLVEESLPPEMDSPNDISIHYTRLIRSLDLSHRRALHDRDVELSSMRDRLNSIDLAYRKELKIRDSIIDTLTTRVNALESAAEKEADRVGVAIGKARNEVEDVWEQRWKDKGKHLIEEFEQREQVLLGRLREAEGQSTHRNIEGEERRKPSKFKTVALMVRAAVRFQHLSDEDG